MPAAVWLSQQQIAELPRTTSEKIAMRLRNVYDEGELDREATSNESLQVRIEDLRSVLRSVAHDDLGAIPTVGFRVKGGKAARNGILDNVDGTLRVSNNALAATTLLVAMSDPKEKDIMISLLVKMVTG